MPRAIWIVSLVCAVVLSATTSGCTRSLRPAVDDPPVPVDGRGAGAVEGAPDAGGKDGAESVIDLLDSEMITIDAPAPGARVTSPVLITGIVELQPGRLPAAQVLSRGADGGLTRRGNGPIPVDDDGRFEALIEYYIDTASTGSVEVVIVDPTSGAVTERERIVVELEAAP